MSRFFNLQEAEKLIPVLENLLGTAIRNKKKVESLDAELTGLSRRVVMLGGMLVDYERAAGIRLQKDSSVGELREALAQIESSGCLVKDLDLGLIDFPCLVDNREIYLCWKLGEPHIEFWHNTDEGFQGRKPIDRETLDSRDPGQDSRPN